MLNAENELKKWAPVLEHADEAPITDSYKKAVTAKLLENTEVALREQAAHSSYGTLNETNQNTGSIDTFDPVLISLVRRAMPNLIAYDVAGVQPMSGPSGLVFSMKAKYGDGNTITGAPSAAQPEAFGEAEPDTAFSGAGAQVGGAFDSPDITAGTGIATGTAETATSFPEMGFSIEKSTVTAKTRQLKAEYTMELAQDLKAVHGLDAESELANILSGEILAEINREVIREIVVNSKLAASAITGNAAVGTFDLSADADGRWAVEKFQSLVFVLDKLSNVIAKETRRGKGNFVICSSNVASALAATGNIQFGGADLKVDNVGNTFAGTLNGGLKVYVDPYATTDYATVGYKGSNAFDAGMFYCPYVPLTMVRAVGESTFQPKIAFKTRYGLVANPLIGEFNSPGVKSVNPYYQSISNVQNIGVK
jgi:hypothetical protein